MNKKGKLIFLFLVAASVIIVVHFVQTNFTNGPLAEGDLLVSADTVETENIEIEKEYGIAVDSFHIIRGRINRNQNLASILSKFNVSNLTIHNISLLPKEVFDARRIRAGNNYALFIDRIDSNSVHYFVYEKNNVDFVRIHLKDSIIAETGSKEINTERKTASGTIKTSLWHTITGNGLDPMIAIKLSEIYAWSVDFFRLQPGDHFKIIYDHHYVEDNPIGIGDIHAAYFNHREECNYAIPFEQDGVLSFYDIEGNSLRRTFLKAPLRYSRISSGFSHSRMHPVLGVRRPHHGVDYVAPAGTPVYAIGDGEIIETSYRRAEGRMIRIRHNSVYTSGYLHLQNFAENIKPGVEVKQGDVIGYVGSTGVSTGPHLDFRMWRHGQPVNPLSIESPPVEPVRIEKMEAFENVREKWLKEMEKLNLSH